MSSTKLDTITNAHGSVDDEVNKDLMTNFNSGSPSLTS